MQPRKYYTQTSRSRTSRNKPKRRRRYPEFQIQVSLASLLRLYYPDLLWYAVPNGGRRRLQDAIRFKAMGVRAGVYDIHIAEPTPVYPGMFLELKAPGKGRESNEQLAFKAMAEYRGYHCVVCDSAIKALLLIEEYLGIPRAQRIGLMAANGPLQVAAP
jgi:hypothetical protein